MPTAHEQAHPQAIEPVAGEGGVSRTTDQPGAASPLHHPHDRAPTEPASISSFPAKGAPSDAEVRAEVARFQLAIARYHLDRLDLSGALIDPSRLAAGQYNTSIASVFTDYGLPIACGVSFVSLNSVSPTRLCHVGPRSSSSTADEPSRSR